MDTDEGQAGQRGLFQEQPRTLTFWEGTSNMADLPSAVRHMRLTSSTSASGRWRLRWLKTKPGRSMATFEWNCSVVKSSCAVSSERACVFGTQKHVHVRGMTRFV